MTRSTASSTRRRRSCSPRQAHSSFSKRPTGSPDGSGLWEAVGYLTSDTRNFVADKGREKVHRRSLYTFWKRTAPPPQMTAFDAPSREACRMRRERTNTPLQALVLLNEPQYVEAARALAERTMKEGGTTTEDRLAYLFRRATGRRADAVDDHLALAGKSRFERAEARPAGQAKVDQPSGLLC